MNQMEAIATQNRINTLLDRPQLTEDDRDYLRLLGMLIFDYEERTEPMPTLTSVELLQALIEEFQLETPDLIPLFGSQEAIAEILAGDRPVTDSQTRALWILLAQLDTSTDHSP